MNISTDTSDSNTRREVTQTCILKVIVFSNVLSLVSTAVLLKTVRDQ
jgi:hypothetical protein